LRAVLRVICAGCAADFVCRAADPQPRRGVRGVSPHPHRTLTSTTLNPNSNPTPVSSPTSIRATTTTNRCMSPSGGSVSPSLCSRRREKRPRAPL
jgi:hypothetical protein